MRGLSLNPGGNKLAFGFGLILIKAIKAIADTNKKTKYEEYR